MSQGFLLSPFMATITVTISFAQQANKSMFLCSRSSHGQYYNNTNKKMGESTASSSQQIYPPNQNMSHGNEEMGAHTVTPCDGRIDA